MNTRRVDARNVLCPLPVIRTQDAVAGMATGDRLEVVCTDPGALQDIPTWCRINGHRVLDTREDGDDIVIRIEVGEHD